VLYAPVRQSASRLLQIFSCVYSSFNVEMSGIHVIASVGVKGGVA